jgi:hypothetical protein
MQTEGTVFKHLGLWFELIHNVFGVLAFLAVEIYILYHLILLLFFHRL